MVSARYTNTSFYFWCILHQNKCDTIFPVSSMVQALLGEVNLLAQGHTASKEERGLTPTLPAPSLVLYDVCFHVHSFYGPLHDPTSRHLVKQLSLRTGKLVQLGGISLSLFEALPWLHFKLYNFPGCGSEVDAGYWQELYFIWLEFSSQHDSTHIKRLGRTESWNKRCMGTLLIVGL